MDHIHQSNKSTGVAEHLRGTGMSVWPAATRRYQTSAAVRIRLQNPGKCGFKRVTANNQLERRVHRRRGHGWTGVRICVKECRPQGRKV